MSGLRAVVVGAAALVLLAGSGEAGADPRRKYYRLTPAGRSVLAGEARRLEHLVNAARARRVLPDAT